jgi:chemotaxis protein CheD
MTRPPAPDTAPPPQAPGDSPRLRRLRAAPRRPGEASFFFYDAHFRNDAVKVMPGEFAVHDEDILILTTLGSCIAACLWDRQRGVGGMNHFMLPEGMGQGGDAGRFGTVAMELLVGEMIRRGATRATMEAKVFGGAAVVPAMRRIHVGEHNTRFVLDYLRAQRIPVVSQDVLDIHPRKVCFWPSSGMVRVKRLAGTRTADLLAQEQAAARRAAPAALAGGPVDLF